MNIESSTLAAYRARARNTNVNDVTLLATDYLNHFNEAVMLAELVVDMPDLLGDLKEWSPISYQDHFRKSGIADRNLAIEAYDYSPDVYKSPLSDTIKRLNDEILDLQIKLEGISSLEYDHGRKVAANQCALIRDLIERARAIINGHLSGSIVSQSAAKSMVEEEILDQDKINAIFDEKIEF